MEAPVSSWSFWSTSSRSASSISWCRAWCSCSVRTFSKTAFTPAARAVSLPWLSWKAPAVNSEAVIAPLAALSRSVEEVLHVREVEEDYRVLHLLVRGERRFELASADDPRKRAGDSPR